MENREQILKWLDEKLNKAHIKPKDGLDYLEAWHVISEANRIFGYDGWSYDIKELKEISKETRKTSKGELREVGYQCVVTVNAIGVSRQGVGYGNGLSYKDWFSCYEGAGKEAESDAVKRALRSFGNQFGLALYDKDKKNVTDRPEPTDKEKKESLEKAETYARTIMQKLDACSDISEYDKLTTEEGKNLSALKKRYPDIYNDLDVKKEEVYLDLTKEKNNA